MSLTALFHEMPPQMRPRYAQLGGACRNAVRRKIAACHRHIQVGSSPSPSAKPSRGFSQLPP
jgi:hypothetical protein